MWCFLKEENKSGGLWSAGVKPITIAKKAKCKKITGEFLVVT